MVVATINMQTDILYLNHIETFVMNDNFSGLIGNINPIYIFTLILRLRQHKILLLKGPFASRLNPTLNF